MSPKELKDLRNLLTTFQVEALGQGDIQYWNQHSGLHGRCAG